MNTNAYPAQMHNMPPPLANQQQQFTQQQQQQMPTNYPPASGAWPPPPTTTGSTSMDGQMSFNNMPAAPPTMTGMPPASAAGAVPQQQQMLNGNYQQQLNASMGGLTINPNKQGPFAPTPNQQQQQTHQQQQPTSFGPPPTVGAAPFNNANTFAPPPLINNQQQTVNAPPPTATNINNNLNAYATTQPTVPTSFANGPVPNTTGAPASAPPRPMAYPTPTPQAVAGMNQMSMNSPNIQGLPHMPAKQVPPPHAAYAPQQNQQFTGQQQQPPQPMMQNMPPMPNQMPQPGQNAGQAYPQMPAYAGMKQQMPGYPPQPAAGYPAQPAGAYPQQPAAGYPQAGAQLPAGNRPGFNQPPMPSGNMYQQPQMQAAQPQRRLDPDQMPNPIQVMIENQRAAGGVFVTNQPGLLPPLVTTNYTVQDQGNCSPRYVRSSLYTIPATADIIKSVALPFTLIVSPFARAAEGEFEPPIVDFGALGPIRCNRCKAYMSPNMQFIDAGRRFQCLMCKVSTEVPTEYFQHLDHTGQRVDKYERPELVLGTYEFLATKDYCRNNSPPEVPAFIFIIDVSYNTIKSGLVHLLCSQIKQILKHLPVDQNDEKSKVRVGFITYNSSVHFYNIQSSLAQPQMMVVGDVQDMFMPLLNGFLCHPEESEAVIDALMEQIPKMFIDTKETETILYPAIQAGLEALKASNCTGKLLIFNSTLPIAEAPGKLKNREDRKLLGTEKEKTILTPQCTNYNTLGQECVQHGCSVDLFVFNNSYIDIATIGQVSRLTGGEVYKYTYFQADIDGKRLIEDIKKNISRPIGFDAVMRVRTSTGIRATDFYGHYFMSNTTDVELACIDATKSIAVEIKHDDKLSPDENVYLQIALLYTSCSGQRRLRVFNLALNVSTTIADVFKVCDLDAMMLFFAKQACFKLMELTPKQVKENLIHRSAQILAAYRKHCTSPTSAGQLILPECLKLLPLYVSCLLKNDAISGGADMTIDERSYVIQFVLAMDLNMSVSFLYPRFLPLHTLIDATGAVDESNELPMPIRCTHEKMSEDGAYILENGVFLFVWLGQSLPQNFIQPLFGVQCTQQVNAERFAITTNTPLGQSVQNIIDNIMAERTRYMRITCIRQNDKLENVFRHFLVEDRGTDGTASYVDFLCHMHKEIKDLLS